MKHRITLIPGDGIGPEVAAAVVKIIEASGVEIEWEEHIAGQQALDKFGKTLPDELIESIQRNKVGLKGPITTPVGKGFTSVNVGLRKTLDLYSNLRPIRALPNIPCRNPNLDLVVVSPGGTTYRGTANFSGGFSQPQPNPVAADPNNVEMVIVAAPDPGAWREGRRTLRLGPPPPRSSRRARRRAARPPDSRPARRSGESRAR